MSTELLPPEKGTWWVSRYQLDALYSVEAITTSWLKGRTTWEVLLRPIHESGYGRGPQEMTGIGAFYSLYRPHTNNWWQKLLLDEEPFCGHISRPRYRSLVLPSAWDRLIERAVPRHVHPCPMCQDEYSCEEACKLVEGMTLDDGTPSGMLSPCEMCLTEGLDEDFDADEALEATEESLLLPF